MTDLRITHASPRYPVYQVTHRDFVHFDVKDKVERDRIWKETTDRISRALGGFAFCSGATFKPGMGALYVLVIEPTSRFMCVSAQLGDWVILMPDGTLLLVSDDHFRLFYQGFNSAHPGLPIIDWEKIP